MSIWRGNTPIFSYTLMPHRYQTFWFRTLFSPPHMSTFRLSIQLLFSVFACLPVFHFPIFFCHSEIYCIVLLINSINFPFMIITYAFVLVNLIFLCQFLVFVLNVKFWNDDNYFYSRSLQILLLLFIYDCSVSVETGWKTKNQNFSEMTGRRFF